MDPLINFCHVFSWKIVDNYIVYDSDDGLILATIKDDIWQCLCEALVCHIMLVNIHPNVKPINLTPEDVIQLIINTTSTLQTPEGQAQSSNGLADAAIKTETLTLPTEDNFMGACVKRQSPKVIELQGNLEKPQNGGSVRRRRQLRW